MRIISGKFKGKVIQAPKSLPVRPTTDFAKTGLFNILRNRYNLTEIDFLDLFCGTGNITYEMASEGAKKILAADVDYGCVNFVNKTLNDMNYTSGKAIRVDVFKFLEKTGYKFDIIFADPPYELSNVQLIPALIFQNEWLNKGGMFILEHQAKDDYSSSSKFYEKRRYGNVGFSFFMNE